MTSAQHSPTQLDSHRQSGLAATICNSSSPACSSSMRPSRLQFDGSSYPKPATIRAILRQGTGSTLFQGFWSFKRIDLREGCRAGRMEEVLDTHSWSRLTSAFLRSCLFSTENNFYEPIYETDVYDAAQASGASSRLETTTQIVVDGGVPFVLRTVASLNSKPKPQVGGRGLVQLL